MEVQDNKAADFGRLFLRYRDRFVAIARSYVREQATAEDIVSECFASYLERRDALKIIHPESYILKSVKNRCLNHLRDNAKMIQAGTSDDTNQDDRLKAMLPEISALSSEDMADIFSTEVRAIFTRFLDGLPEQSRSIFLFSRSGDMTYEKIAARYGVTPRKVKREIQTALKQLREELKDYLPAIILLLSSPIF